MRENFTQNFRTLTHFEILFCPQEVDQLAGTTPHEAEVISSNPPLPPLVWTCQKKKKNPLNLKKLSI
jgi:hypothetical protein